MSKAGSTPLQWCLKVEIDSKIILCTGMLNRPEDLERGCGKGLSSMQIKQGGCCGS